MRRVIIQIEDDDWQSQDIAYEIREVANAIEENDSRGGLTNFGNNWSVE